MENKIKRKGFNFVNYLLWFIYILLLLVLLPHTAWMFSRGEPQEAGEFGIAWGLVTAWSAALVFECVIAVMTHKLSKHIDHSPKYSNDWKRFRSRYLNAYGAGLLLAWIVSTYANLAHAVEYGQPIKIFSDWGLPVWSYSVAFGAILPTASLLFAWVLSSVIEQDANEPNELEKAKNELEKAKREFEKIKAGLELEIKQLQETLEGFNSDLDNGQKNNQRIDVVFESIKNKNLKIETLASEYQVSSQTIYNDIKKLETQGAISKNGKGWVVKGS